ncbi:hypothetical protein EON77_06775, partial [bacterium]
MLRAVVGRSPPSHSMLSAPSSGAPRRFHRAHSPRASTRTRASHGGIAHNTEAMARFEISTDFLRRFLTDLLNTPSPTGDTDYAVSLVEGELMSLDIPAERTRKGALVSRIEGFQRDKPRALAAHVDTLGAMISRIKPNGRLAMTALNGLNWPTVESEGVTISTRNGRQIRGSVVFANGAAHVNPAAKDGPRNATTLEIRLDERTRSAEE